MRWFGEWLNSWLGKWSGDSTPSSPQNWLGGWFGNWFNWGDSAPSSPQNWLGSWFGNWFNWGGVGGPPSNSPVLTMTNGTVKQDLTTFGNLLIDKYADYSSYYTHDDFEQRLFFMGTVTASSFHNYTISMDEYCPLTGDNIQVGWAPDANPDLTGKDNSEIIEALLYSRCWLQGGPSGSGNEYTAADWLPQMLTQEGGTDEGQFPHAGWRVYVIHEGCTGIPGGAGNWCATGEPDSNVNDVSTDSMGIEVQNSKREIGGGKLSSLFIPERNTQLDVWLKTPNAGAKITIDNGYHAETTTVLDDYASDIRGPTDENGWRVRNPGLFAKAHNVEGNHVYMCVWQEWDDPDHLIVETQYNGEYRRTPQVISVPDWRMNRPISITGGILQRMVVHEATGGTLTGSQYLPKSATLNNKLLYDGPTDKKRFTLIPDTNSTWQQTTITITGSPDIGNFSLVHDERTIGPFTGDTTAADLQTAMRTWPACEEVTVTATGSAPNPIYLITWIGLKTEQTITTIGTTNLTDITIGGTASSGYWLLTCDAVQSGPFYAGTTYYTVRAFLWDIDGTITVTQTGTYPDYTFHVTGMSANRLSADIATGSFNGTITIAAPEFNGEIAIEITRPFSVGVPLFPTSGTFDLIYIATTYTFAYNVSPSTISSTLNADAQMILDGGCTVTSGQASYSTGDIFPHGWIQIEMNKPGFSCPGIGAYTFDHGTILADSPGHCQTCSHYCDKCYRGIPPGCVELIISGTGIPHVDATFDLALGGFGPGEGCFWGSGSPNTNCCHSGAPFSGCKISLGQDEGGYWAMLDIKYGPPGGGVVMILNGKHYLTTDPNVRPVCTNMDFVFNNATEVSFGTGIDSGWLSAVLHVKAKNKTDNPMGGEMVTTCNQSIFDELRCVNCPDGKASGTIKVSMHRYVIDCATLEIIGNVGTFGPWYLHQSNTEWGNLRSPCYCSWYFNAGEGGDSVEVFLDYDHTLVYFDGSGACAEFTDAGCNAQPSSLGKAVGDGGCSRTARCTWGDCISTCYLDVFTISFCYEGGCS